MAARPAAVRPGETPRDEPPSVHVDPADPAKSAVPAKPTLPANPPPPAKPTPHAKPQPPLHSAPLLPLGFDPFARKLRSATSVVVKLGAGASVPCTTAQSER